MTRIHTVVLSVFLGAACLVAQAPAKRAQTDTPEKLDRAEAYYRYSLGHLYAELATTYGNRGEYFTKAIENYRLALKADPSATFISEELSDLYIQSGRLREAMAEAEDVLRQNPKDLNARRVLARIYARMIGDSQANRVNEEMLKKAIEQYTRITQDEPGDTDSWLMLGRLQKVGQNSVEAEKAYKKVLDQDPNNEDALTGLAMVYSDLGDNKEAAEVLKRLSDKAPSARSLTALASTYEQMREYGLAAEALKKAIDLSPSNLSELKHALAQDLMLSDQLADSLKIYQQLVAEDPKDVQSQLRISQIYRQQRDYAKAREANDKARALDPDSVEIRYNEVNLLEAEGKSTEAIKLMKDILASTAKKTYNPAERGNRSALLERLGFMYRNAEQFGPAVDAFRQIAELDPDLAARAEAQIIETYRAGKDFKKAEQEVNTAVSKYPDDRMIRSVQASLLADIGQTDGAVAILKKQLGEKKDRETYLALAQVYEKGKRFDDMAKAIDEAEKLSQSKDDKETISFMRGAMYERLKRYEEAEAEFRKVIAMNPENSSAMNYLGYMFAERGEHLQEAMQLINKALELEPNNAAYMDSLGWVLFRMDRLPEAEQQLKLSLEKLTRDPTVHDHLGDVYFRQGRLKEAIGQWEASLKEYQTGAPAENEPLEVAKVQKKLEGARVRLAKESPQQVPAKP
jgi:tetratricopeptide (TPR) repeat protein